MPLAESPQTVKFIGHGFVIDHAPFYHRHRKQISGRNTTSLTKEPMGSISKRLKSLIQSNQSVDPRDSIDPVKSDSNGLSPEAVRWAYRLYLDREPEREQVVEEHLRKCTSTEELRANFIYSTEFREKNPTLHVPVLLGNEPPMSIEHTCSEEVLQSLFDRVQSIWQEL